MAANTESIEKTLGTASEQINETLSKASTYLNDATVAVNDAVQRGVSAVKDQIQTVKDYGVDGVKNDVSEFTRTKPLKALLIAGGIGALAALIITRRR